MVLLLPCRDHPAALVFLFCVRICTQKTSRNLRGILDFKCFWEYFHPINHTLFLQYLLPQLKMPNARCKSWFTLFQKSWFPLENSTITSSYFIYTTRMYQVLQNMSHNVTHSIHIHHHSSIRIYSYIVAMNYTDLGTSTVYARPGRLSRCGVHRPSNSWRSVLAVLTWGVKTWEKEVQAMTKQDQASTMKIYEVLE